MNGFSHEEPILLVLPASQRVESSLPLLLDHPEVRHHTLPPLWCLDKAGIDLPAALPACPAITRESLEEVLGTLIRLCDADHLDDLVRRAWREADERVRQHHLALGVGQTFATIFKMAPRTVDRAPPPSFKRDRIHENGFEIQYRLVADGETPDFRAPLHEGSVVLYPFDPRNEEARAEAGLGGGDGAVLEVFAYEPARARHRAFLEGAASALGWEVVDPRLSG